MKRFGSTASPVSKKSPFKPQKNSLDRYFSVTRKIFAATNHNQTSETQIADKNEVSKFSAKRRRQSPGGSREDDKIDNCGNMTISIKKIRHTNDRKPNTENLKRKVVTRGLKNSKDLSPIRENLDKTCFKTVCKQNLPEVLVIEEKEKHTKRSKRKFSEETVSVRCKVSKDQSINGTTTPDYNHFKEHKSIKHASISTVSSDTDRSSCQAPIENSTKGLLEFKQSAENVINKETNPEIPLSNLSNQLLEDYQFTPEKKKISGSCFKDVVYGFFYNDFCRPFNKFKSGLSPHCCDQAFCVEKHKTATPEEISSFSNGPFFNILDNPFESWVYDLSSAAFSVLRPEQYFRGDVLRVLFDYIINGPSKEVVWEVKHIVSTHWDIHPPCTHPMRLFYLQLLDQPYNDESYFKTELTAGGVLNIVFTQLEEHFPQPPATPSKRSRASFLKEEEEEEKEQDNSFQGITFEVLEERHNNFLPLLDDELNQAVDALNDVSDSIDQTDVTEGLNQREILERLIVALELIVDLLEADFLICVSKLKRNLSGDSGIPEVPEPLIQHFVNKDLHFRVFKLLAKIPNQDLSDQLTRLVGLAAEQVHMFPCRERLWQYPNLHSGCTSFSSQLFNSLRDCNWSEEAWLGWLQSLCPAWLKLFLTLSWTNCKLNPVMGCSLKALVDIIHLHVKSPVKLEKNVKKAKYDNILMSEQSSNLAKQMTKKNKYGESRLHLLCKKKGSSMSEFHNVLAMTELDVNAKDNHGWTPLHEAVFAQSILKTKHLLQYKPPPGREPIFIGVQNSEGITPLHEAVEADNLELCQLLVDYGGVCLLKKTDNKGLTPLDLAMRRPKIKEYFEKTIKKQEQLNLSPDSVLILSEDLIRSLMLIWEAFTEVHHTHRIYHMMRYDLSWPDLTYQPWVVIDKGTLLRFKRDQDQFRKLRRVLLKLSENPENSPLVRLWNSTLQNVPDCKPSV